jgi:hypothetical protein
MNRTNVALAVALGAALAGCQRAPQKVAASPSPSAYAPGSTLANGQASDQFVEPAPYSPAPAVRMEPAGEMVEAPHPDARHSAPRTSGTSGTSTSSRSTTAPRTSTAPRTASTGTSTGTGAPASAGSHRSDRVDRTPAAEPIDIPAEAPRREASGGASRPVAPEREVERLTIPAGTELQLVVEEELSSGTSKIGDKVTARVTRATSPDGAIVLPGGTVLRGRVYRADAAGRVKGKSHLSVDFDRITIRGVEQRLDTTAIDVEGPDSHGRDAAIIGGSTVGGAIVGGILGGGDGAKKGAVVGAVGGTGAVLATRGKDVTIPAGSHWTVHVKNRVAL